MFSNRWNNTGFFLGSLGLEGQRAGIHRSISLLVCLVGKKMRNLLR